MKAASITYLLSLLAVPVVLAAKPAAPPPAPPPAAADSPGETVEERHRGIEWHAAAGFFSLGSMTVVYPAGPGEPVEINRRSAEARARWLVAVHKNKVDVAADDQLTDEQKKGNLLVLGWTNRVFNPPGPKRPFSHDTSGTTFLGLQESDPKIDLLVFHRNPMNWDSFLLFWSRIDPERDRFQVVPKIGSDWAMYRDYHPVRQGMFLPARVWPPNRDQQAEADHTSEDFLRPGGTASFDSPHYHLVFDRAAFTDEDVKAIAAARESAFAKAVAMIGPAPDGFRIQLSIYPDETAKLEATGVTDPSHAVPATREIHSTKRFALAPSPREELHLLARSMYGPCYLSAICEGLALSYLGTWHGDDMEMTAASLRFDKKLPLVDTLLDEERFRALTADEAAVGAGMFVGWLRDTYGAPSVKKIYGLTGGGASAFAAALGMQEAQLTSAYTLFTDGLVAKHKDRLDFLAAEDEAQARRLSGDWKGMSESLKKALKAKPGDPQTLFNLASAQMRADDFAGAEASLKQMLEKPLAPADSRFRIFGHYQLGRVYDLAGRRDEALAEYDAVLALPDDHGAHALAKERKERPATKEQLE